jgi:amino acid transporter
MGLIAYVSNASENAVEILGGTTALLLLAVFTVVNITCLVLRRDPQEHDHFRAPTPLPVIGALACAYLVTPLSGRESEQYEVAGLLLVLGVVLWAITWIANRALRGRKTHLRDPSDLH